MSDRSERCVRALDTCGGVWNSRRSWPNRAGPGAGRRRGLSGLGEGRSVVIALWVHQCPGTSPGPSVAYAQTEHRALGRSRCPRPRGRARSGGGRMISGVVKSASAHRPISPAAVEVPTTWRGTPGHVRVLEQPIQDVVEASLGLIRRAGLDMERVYFLTYAGGDSPLASQVKPFNQLDLALQTRGVSQARIVRAFGDRMLTNMRRAGQPAGPRCEVFYKTDLGTFTEVGTLVFEQFLLSSDLRTLLPRQRHVYGAAFCIASLTNLVRPR